MVLAEIRRDNLVYLLEHESGQKSRAQVARELETAPSYLCSVLSDKYKATLGENLARRIEVYYRKPKGWLDMRHEEQDAPPHYIYTENQIGKNIPEAALEPLSVNLGPLPEGAFGLRARRDWDFDLPVLEGSIVILTTGPISTEPGRNNVALRMEDGHIRFFQLVNGDDGMELIARPMTPHTIESEAEAEMPRRLWVDYRDSCVGVLHSVTFTR